MTEEVDVEALVVDALDRLPAPYRERLGSARNVALVEKLRERFFVAFESTLALILFGPVRLLLGHLHRENLHARLDVARIFAANGRSLAVGPGVGSTHAAATAVAAAVGILNQVAGNVGTTLHIDRAEAPARQLGSYADMQALMARMQSGSVGAVLFHDANPLFTMPGGDALSEALGWLADETDLHEMLGKEFITVYSEVKEIEHDEFMKVISPWEREHLLLNV